ncbi:MAG TPA: host attachment protein [Pirellulales bacterium]|jgi:protein required for attachment to host cells|nr:host attachment protein [Pirellulales bacterium]
MKQRILVADASRARVFSVPENNKPNQPWLLKKELDHPASRAKATDLTTDVPGRVRQSFGAGSRPAMDDPTDPKEVEAQAFARSLAEFLEQGFNHNRFEQLVLVAPPHFLGLLRETVSEQVANRIRHSINKDYTQLPARDLPSHIKLGEE